MHSFNTRLATLLALVLLASAPARAAKLDADPPRIAGCRIGFDGSFKVGHWTPVWVDVAGKVAAARPHVEVATVDSDGVEVTVSSGDTSIGPTLLYTRVGRLGSGVTVKLVGDDGRVLDRLELNSTDANQTDTRYAALPATGQLIVQIGPADLDISHVLDAPEATDGSVAGAAVELTDVESLPTDWFGYEGVDVLVLTTSDAAFCERLVADKERFAAIGKWLELGGQLVICAGRTAPELLAPGKPLAGFVPGEVGELVRLPQARALETFAGSGDAVSQSGAQQNIPLPQLVEVAGRVDLFGRQRDLPIIVRAARGLGELVFVGVDLSESPLAEWNGRRAFLQAVLRPFLAEADANRTKRKIVSLGYDDLAGALRQRLGRTIAGVSTIGFPWVAAIVIAYLLVLGPLDYWLVDRVTRRPWIAWLTLPAIVVGTCVGAALLAGAAKRTDGPRVNHAELVDFDLTTGRTRGICWATLYSPRAERFDVTLAPRWPDATPVTDAQTLVSWLGLPGSGLGGMHAAGEPLDVTSVGYRQSTNLNALDGLPILTASTKSLSAQWDRDPPPAGAAPPLAADLSVNDDGLLVGSVTNETGSLLKSAFVLHGRWGYRLGDLPAGERKEIGPQLGAKQVQSTVMRRSVADSASGQENFLAARATERELLNVMMFYEAVGGEAFAGLPNRYQAQCDLSPLLNLDRAILVAVGTNDGSQWTDDAGDALDTSPGDSTIYYRFTIPIQSP